HMRRVERALEEGSIASQDGRLNFPEGAMIPWPSYADDAALSLVGLFAPGDPVERRAFLERTLTWFPFAFGLLSCALLSLAAGALLRSQLGAAVAGLTYALCYGSVHYQVPGIADHHAWVSLLNFGALLICTFSWTRKNLSNLQVSGHKGIAAGVLIGLSIGSWVASLLWLLALQVAMGFLWIRAGERGGLASSAPGLRVFGMCFHAAALVVVLPEVLASPWKQDFPWMVVNLSWFHLAELLMGFLVFLPRRNGQFPALMVPGAAVIVTLLLLVLNLGPGAGIREGFTWVSRADEFMSGIAESSRLTDGYRSWTGIGVFFTPFIVVVWMSQLLSGRRPEYAGLAFVLMLSWAQSISQVRFVEAMMGPAALGYGWLAVEFSRKVVQANLPKWSAQYAARPAPARFGAAFLLAAGISMALVGTESLARPFTHEVSSNSAATARRHLLEWIGDRAPELPAAEAEGSVLAPWDWGHEIEWRARMASVATNFGSYVGEEGYRAPARFFLSTDPAEAEQILRRHQVRYVVRSSQMSLSLDQLQRSFGQGLPEGGFIRTFEDAQGRERTSFRPAWFDTMAAALGVGVTPRPGGSFPGLGDPDGPDGPRNPLGFLRLVHVSPLPDSHPLFGGAVQPHGLIWEYVPGARIVIDSDPGQELRIELGVQVGFAGREVVSFLYRAVGSRELRLPYTTALANGDAEVVYAKWQLVDSAGELVREGNLVVPEEAVRKGGEVRLD
ncbi:MAG: hypothetical protein MK209_00380, partial [Planctomycetes bacterium]|nr:hypothetical protein [Planctomycetota bacterium]